MKRITCTTSTIVAVHTTEVSPIIVSNSTFHTYNQNLQQRGLAHIDDKLTTAICSRRDLATNVQIKVPPLLLFG